MHKKQEDPEKNYLKLIQRFCLLDDAFMTAVFQDNLECVDLVIQIILNNPNLHATNVVTQDTIKNLHGHSVRLDIHAFADGQEFNIEIQRAAEGASERRARYNSSIMDANALETGADYEKLPESYVIFITETDVLKLGQPIYMIKRTIRGSDVAFNDGSHIIYVNASITDTNTPLGKLMHDFRCMRPEEMYYDILAKHTGYFKWNGKGDKKMSTQAEKLLKTLREEMIESERLSSIRAIMKNLEFTAEKAMDTLSIPKAEQGHYKALLQQQ
nr:PD-(D/E)XK nuclease family transposase [uncultured Selenomonas sp.]